MKVDAGPTYDRRVFVLRVRRVTVFLLAIVVLIALANVVAGVVQLFTGRETPILIDVAEESSIPTWYSSILLALAGVVAALVGRVEKQVGGRRVLYWWGLAAAMSYLSIDEMLTIHEALDRFVPRWMTEAFGAWITVHPWVLFGLPMVVVFVVIFIPLLRDLPTRTRRWVLLGGSVYVVGALGGDSLHGAVYTYYGGGIGTSLSVLLEESLEMVGVVIFIHGLLGHLVGRDALVALEVRS